MFIIEKSLKVMFVVCTIETNNLLICNFMCVYMCTGVHYTCMYGYVILYCVIGSLYDVHVYYKCTCNMVAVARQQRMMSLCHNQSCTLGVF